MFNPLILLSKAWDWLDGRKTTIGAITTFAGLTITGKTMLIPAIPALASAAPYLLAVGSGITALGVLHKAIKSGDAAATEAALKQAAAVVAPLVEKPATENPSP